MVTVRLDMKKDCFFAEFSNLGVGNVPIADEYPEKFDRLLCGGIWCIVQLDYEVEGDNNFGIEDIDGNPLRSKQKSRGEQLLRKMNGWIFFFVLSAWSQMNLHTVRNGCS